MIATGYKTISEVLNRQLPPFFFTAADKEETVEEIKKHYPEKVRGTIDDADRICGHVFDLLGSGEIKLEDKIDWHLDFKSGFRWNPKAYYIGSRRHIDCYLKQGIPADIKVPWELSRCQHFVTLGKAYWLTGDEKYTREFANEVSHWIDSNPVELGVNWASTMDVAIRAINWLWGYYYFIDSPSLSEEFRLSLLKSLFLHGRHITDHLDLGPVRDNHYLADIVGLVYMGLFFGESEEGRTWLHKGWAALQAEMDYQICEDGVDFEGSISYQRLMTEFFLSATILCIKDGRDFPKRYMQKLEKMLEFVLGYVKPDGTAPQIGDNDDGRLHILSRYGGWNRLDHRYLLATGAVLFNRPDFKLASGKFNEEALWLLGTDGLLKFNKLANPESAVCSQAFVSGGFYIMRRGSLYMAIDCIPPNDGGPSGHRHNSRLSFELFAYDKSFIVDPGAYIYTADKVMRNLFRSTGYHNTIVVDSKEQNSLDKNQLFRMGSDATVKINRWESTDDHDFLDAEHHGYQRLAAPIIHRRLIFFNKSRGFWIIRDILTGTGRHRFDLYFHFAPLEVEGKTEFPLMVTTKTKGANLAIIPLDTGGLSMEIEKGWVSRRYGVKLEAPVVRYQKEAEVPAEFSYALYPYRGELDTSKAAAEIKISDEICRTLGGGR